MGRFVLYYLSFTFLINALIGIWLNIFFTLFILPAFLFFKLGNLAKVKKQDLTVVEGLFLGDGEDLENPDRPKKIKAWLEQKAMDLGILSIGSPGSGKSIAAIIYLAYFTITRKIGWCYWEGKGDKDIYQTCVAAGCKPDKFFSSELTSTDTTNVVAGDTEAVIEALTQTLIKSDNEYYRGVQREALNVVVPLLKSLEQPINLRDIYLCLRNEEARHYVLNMAEKQNVETHKVEMARQFFNQDAEAMANDLKGLLTNMSLFVNGHVAERLNDYEPSLDFVEASKKGLSVYLHLPYTSLSKDIAIMFTEQIGVIAKQRQLYDKIRRVWPQVYDDWGAFFYANFGPITARNRSAKMPCNFLFQSKGQTDDVDKSGIFTTQITDNIGSLIAFRTNGAATRKWVSEEFGEYETDDISSMKAGESRSTRWQPRVRPDELKNLDAGECRMSTLVSGSGGQWQNKTIKARFPMPDQIVDPDTVDWPEIDTQDNSEKGLNLWGVFMNKNRLDELKKEIADSALNTNEDAPNVEEFDDL